MAKTVIDYQQELFNYLANELDVTALVKHISVEVNES